MTSCLLLNSRITFGILIAILSLVCPKDVAVYAATTAPIRAIHFVLGPADPKHAAVDITSAKRIITLAQKHGFNTAVVQVANAIKLDAVPDLARPAAWTKAQCREFISFSRNRGITVIPEVKLLSHQEKLFGDRYPELMYNQKTYDPRNDKSYVKVFAILDEIIELFRPPAVHIGHDEVAGFMFTTKLGLQRPAWLKKGEGMLPADLFLQDVQRVHAHLKKKGVGTWIWSDMLISSDEFVAMSDSGLHGPTPGYGKELRSRMPRDIVICDWHYYSKQKEFPTLSAFKKEGFTVLGATWKDPGTIRNFSQYAAAHGADGMIATTWFHVPRKEWDVVEDIIKISGEAFLNAK